MKNKDRWAQPYALGNAVNGEMSVAGLEIGTSGTANGAVVCIRTNGGALVALGAPGTQTGQVPEEPSETEE